MMLAHRVTIVIATKNRWPEVESTFHSLRECGMADIPVLLMDDGSDLPCPEHVLTVAPQCRSHRESVSLGYIAQRNRLAHAVDTDYLISLDDDSSFHDDCRDALEKAIAFCDEHPDVAVLRFRTIDGPPPLPPFESDTAPPTATDTFVGCGYLARVSTFLALTGFRTWFQAYGEERDYSLRVYRAGARVVFFPSVVIHHRYSQLGRSSARRAFWTAQNTLSTWALNLPTWRLPLGLVRCAAGLVGVALTRPRILVPTIFGLLSGCAQSWLRRDERAPLSETAFARWRQAGRSPVSADHVPSQRLNRATSMGDAQPATR